MSKLNDRLKKHAEWVESNGESGEFADFSGEDLRGVDLRYANLQGANLQDANLPLADFHNADLRRADFSRANLECANFVDADLRLVRFTGANLVYANFCRSNLGIANLCNANLREANFCDANLNKAEVRFADLTGANVIMSDLRETNLSGAVGIPNAIDWICENFESTADGVICYKSFASIYQPNPTWEIRPGSVLAENVNPNPTEDCGCGINVATLEWVCSDDKLKQIWKCLIRWPWLAGVVVPYRTNGKFRAARVELIETVRV